MKSIKTILTEEKIHQFYKLVACSIIGISLILAIIPIGASSIRERIGIVLSLNIGFHMFYYLLSIVPIKQLNYKKSSSKIPDLFYKSLMLIMSYGIIFSCLFASFYIVKEVISAHQNNNLTSLLVVLGVILGTLKLNLRLRKRQ